MQNPDGFSVKIILRIRFEQAEVSVSYPHPVDRQFAMAPVVVCAGTVARCSKVLQKSDFKCTMPPSTHFTDVTQCDPKTNHTIRNHKSGTAATTRGAVYPIQTIINHRSLDQLLEFRTGFHEIISS